MLKHPPLDYPSEISSRAALFTNPSVFSSPAEVGLQTRIGGLTQGILLLKFVFFSNFGNVNVGRFFAIYIINLILVERANFYHEEYFILQI